MEYKINTEAGKLSYRTIGKGKPVMLVHGFGEDAGIWDGTICALSDYFKLLVPQLPGTGGSDMLEGQVIGMEDYAKCLQEILKAEGIDKCVMIGHSMGGYITLAFAEKYGQMLQAFGLYHSSALADSEEKKEARLKGIAFIQQHGAAAFVKSTLPNLFAHIGIHRKEAAVLEENAKSFTAAALAQYYRAMIARPDRTNVLKNSRVPVLFILGEHDKAVPFEQGLQQTHLPQKSFVHILRNSGHLGMLEEPEKTYSILRLFLDSL